MCPPLYSITDGTRRLEAPQLFTIKFINYLTHLFIHNLLEVISDGIRGPVGRVIQSAPYDKVHRSLIWTGGGPDPHLLRKTNTFFVLSSLLAFIKKSVRGCLWVWVSELRRPFLAILPKRRQSLAFLRPMPQFSAMPRERRQSPDVLRKRR